HHRHELDRADEQSPACGPPPGRWLHLSALTSPSSRRPSPPSTALAGFRVALTVSLGAQLGLFDGNLVALLVEVHVLVLVAASLLVTATLLPRRHARPSLTPRVLPGARSRRRGSLRGGTRDTASPAPR